MESLELSNESLSEAIEEAMPGQRYRLRRKLRNLKRIRDEKHESRIREKLADEIRASAALRQQRIERAPQAVIQPSLPIAEHCEELQRAIADHPIVIVAGETGSGKSTQLPKLCLQMGRGIEQTIGVTQPRRIAARAIAARIANELDVELGDLVGFKTRFHEQLSPLSCVKVMTDGVLLNQIERDRYLNEYDTLIIDEAHERSLNIDFLLGYIKTLVDRRPDLRCIVTSATLDVERISEHFARHGEPAPVLTIQGRTYPVEVDYRPGDEEELSDESLWKACCDQIDAVVTDRWGDALVFLPTERDIREVTRILRGRRQNWTNPVEILPLYARLSAKEQNRVFESSNSQRIVLATNVAESSLTVPNIKVVIDSGLARISRFAAKSKTRRLPIEAISQASAEQRRGRAGRTAAGHCIRLYSEESFSGRARFTTPEIRRTNLSAVILKTKSLRLGQIDEFPFLDPPNSEAVRSGLKSLLELNAIDGSGNLTEIGKQLSRLPVDPTIGRIILEAKEHDCLAETLIIAAALEVRDPRENPADQEDQARACHAEWNHPKSDFLSYINLWDACQEKRQSVSRSQFRKFAKRNFLSWYRLREWMDVYLQLRRMVKQFGWNLNERSDDYDAIHKSLLSGLIAGVGYRSRGFEYCGAGGKKFFMWPGSGLFTNRPKWLLAFETFETSKLYGRTLGSIRPEWIESTGAHLLSRSYRDPIWSRKRGRALVSERVSIFGIPVIRRRTIDLARVDKQHARELLIREGLIGGHIGKLPFHEQNKQLLLDLESFAAKQRDSHWFVVDQKLFDFYDERIPLNVVDVWQLKRWLKKEGHNEPLLMKADDLLEEVPAIPEETDFPSAIQSDHLSLPVEYAFRPGEEEDGLTVVIPKQVFHRIPVERFDWMVPGILREKVIALIRSLPKDLRRSLIPANESAAKVVDLVDGNFGSFLPTIAAALSDLSQEDIRASSFQIEKVPPHLIMNVRIVDEQGTTIASGRDHKQLRDQFGQTKTEWVWGEKESSWNRAGLKTWDFEEIAERIEIDWGRFPFLAFPTLSDEGDSVTQRLADTADVARQTLVGGVRRLIALDAWPTIRAQIAWFPDMDRNRELTERFLPGIDLERLLATLIVAAAQGDRQLVRTTDDFIELRNIVSDNAADVAPEVSKFIGEYLAGLESVGQCLDGLGESSSKDDLAMQLSWLSDPTNRILSGWQWLQQTPRYLEAMVLRVDRLGHGGRQRDQDAMLETTPCMEQWQLRHDKHRQRGKHDRALEEYRWLLEEFRVSLFAQQLGTRISISSQKLAKHWETIGN